MLLITFSDQLFRYSASLLNGLFKHDYANLKTSNRCHWLRNKTATTTAGDRHQTALYTTDRDNI